MTRILEGKLIVLGVTGSIAAVETVRLIHSLRRKGAIVQPVITEAATRIIQPDSLTYASGRTTITRISGHVEHVKFCGEGGDASLLLIAPATANTIAKIACGIDDTPVTTFATTALGSDIPIILAPAMHESMFRNKIILSHLKTLTSLGISIAGPRFEEGKAKVAGESTLIIWCERILSDSKLKGKKVLITGGRCEEAVDDVRVLTTRSTGTMGKEISLEAFRLGAEVTLIHNGEEIPGIKNKHIITAKDMENVVLEEIESNQPDYFISAAAISDFIPLQKEGKLDGSLETTITLLPFPKIIDKVLQNDKIFVIAFKLGRNPVKDGISLLQKGVRLVVGNSAEMPGAKKGEVIFLREGQKEHFSGTKEEIAHELWQRV